MAGDYCPRQSLTWLILQSERPYFSMPIRYESPLQQVNRDFQLHCSLKGCNERLGTSYIHESRPGGKVIPVRIRGGECRVLKEDCPKLRQDERIRFTFRQIESAAKIVRIPNVTVLYNPSTLNQGDKKFSTGKLPVLSINKKEGDPDILVPNSYFGDLKLWQRKTRVLSSFGRRNPWYEKHSYAFWRGSCRRNALSRFKLSQFVNETNFRVEFTTSCSRYNTAILDWLNMSVSELQKRISTYSKGRTTLGRFASYKVIIHMPGSTTNHYSRALQHFLFLNSFILIWENAYYEHYYRSLCSLGLCILVNEFSISHVVKQILLAQKQNAKVAEDQTKFAHKHLSAESIAEYWQAVLGNYSLLYNVDDDDHQWIFWKLCNSKKVSD